MAGITSVSRTDLSIATIQEAWRLGVRWFDTAYSYGYDGESDRLLKTALADFLPQAKVIGKVGQRWTPERVRVVDGGPETLRRDAEESLDRLGVDRFELLLLHQPDPRVSIERSAEALCELRDRGLAVAIGVCNANRAELDRFAKVAPVAATQFGCNLVQQASSEEVRRWCDEHHCAGLAYWVLMKGFLAGKIGRDHQFPPGDSRPSYPIFQPPQREATHQLVEGLGPIAARAGVSIAALVIARTLAFQGIQSALIGALKPEQIRESAAALQCSLSVETIAEIDSLISAWQRCVSAT